MAAKKSNSKSSKYRNAETGQYVTKKYADKHPKTTIKESSKKSKGGGGTDGTGPRKK